MGLKKHVLVPSLELTSVLSVPGPSGHPAVLGN